jgi:hypothetical protein
VSVGLLRNAEEAFGSRGAKQYAARRRTELPEYEIQDYLQQRNSWPDEVYDSVSWAAYGSASAGLTDNLRTFVVTLSHNWLPIGQSPGIRGHT